MLALALTGCMAGKRAPLSAAEKLHFIDCREAVEARLCPDSDDCETAARARLEAVPRADRLDWLMAQGCSPRVIVRRQILLDRWAAERKKPVSDGTKQRWQAEETLKSIGCVLVFPLCLVHMMSKPTR